MVTGREERKRFVVGIDVIQSNSPKDNLMNEKKSREEQ